MAASDYKICPAMCSAYIAKVSKRNPNLMLSDRREITENEILMLIDWYLDKEVTGKSEGGIKFSSHAREGLEIHLQFKKPKENEESNKV